MLNPVPVNSVRFPDGTTVPPPNTGATPAANEPSPGGSAAPPPTTNATPAAQYADSAPRSWYTGAVYSVDPPSVVPSLERVNAIRAPRSCYFTQVDLMSRLGPRSARVRAWPGAIDSVGSAQCQGMADLEALLSYYTPSNRPFVTYSLAQAVLAHAQNLTTVGIRRTRPEPLNRAALSDVNHALTLLMESELAQQGHAQASLP